MEWFNITIEHMINRSKEEKTLLIITIQYPKSSSSTFCYFWSVFTYCLEKSKEILKFSPYLLCVLSTEFFFFFLIDLSTEIFVLEIIFFLYTHIPICWFQRTLTPQRVNVFQMISVLSRLHNDMPIHIKQIKHQTYSMGVNRSLAHKLLNK